MNKGAKWGIGLGVGIPAVLILIGLIGLIIKFFVKRCRKKPWDDITSPKDVDTLEAGESFWNFRKRKSSERQLLSQSMSSANNITETSDHHIVIPVDEKDIPPGQRTKEISNENEQTLVQIHRDRLNHLKEEENRNRPMIRLAYDENEIQRVIDQVQKEFEESV